MQSGDDVAWIRQCHELESVFSNASYTVSGETARGLKSVTYAGDKLGAGMGLAEHVLVAAVALVLAVTAVVLAAIATRIASPSGEPRPVLFASVAGAVFGLVLGTIEGLESRSVAKSLGAGVGAFVLVGSIGVLIYLASKWFRQEW